jgi:hypothetical protein
VTKRAEALTAAILACRDKDGRITKRRVFTAARDDKRSLLGRQFNWNLREAAERHWLDRAGELIKQYITITVVNKSVKIKSVAYVRDPRLPARQEGFCSLADVAQSDAEKITLDELNRCESAILRARAVVGVLDARFPGLSDKLENALSLLVEARTQINSRRKAA